VASAVAQAKSRGVGSLVFPKGMPMMVCREGPFAAMLFCVQPALELELRAYTSLQPWQQSMLAAVGTSCIGSPISHVPSVLVAYQQGHNLSLKESIKRIRARSGLAGFVVGMVPRTVSIASTMFVVPWVMTTLTSWSHSVRRDSARPPEDR